MPKNQALLFRLKEKEAKRSSPAHVVWAIVSQNHNHRWNSPSPDRHWRSVLSQTAIGSGRLSLLTTFPPRFHERTGELHELLARKPDPDICSSPTGLVVGHLDGRGLFERMK